jgi:hypothetical protein
MLNCEDRNKFIQGSGYCHKLDAIIQEKYCIKSCGDHGPAPRKMIHESKPPTLLQMLVHFTKAMIRWTKKGLKTVSKEEYLRRRNLCVLCSGGWRCPRCGCMLWAKAALVSEKCEHWEIEDGLIQSIQIEKQTAVGVE